MCMDIVTDHCPSELVKIYHEHLVVSTYCKAGGTVDSKLIPNLKIEKEEVFTCPRCGSEGKMPEHGRFGECAKCNLGMISYGNSLYIFEKKK